MARIRGFLTSRRVAVALMLAVVVLLLVAGVLPGGPFVLSEGAGSSRLLRVLLLVLLAVSTLSIVMAIATQVRTVRGRFSGRAVPRPKATDAVRDAAGIALLLDRGWRPIPLEREDVTVYGRHRWSSWAGVVLHVGLVFLLIGLSAVLFTESRVVHVVRQGDEVGPDSPSFARYSGPLAGELRVPGTLKLEEVRPVYWESGALSDIASTLTDVATGAEIPISVNTVTRWNGVRIYQSQEFGRTFDLRIVGPGSEGGIVYRIDVPGAAAVGLPGYRDLEIDGIPYLLRLRSIEETSAQGVAPVLAVRFETSDGVSAQHELPVGEARMFADYRVTLVEYRYWEQIIFARQQGVVPTFIGVVLVLFGSIALYLFPASYVYVVREDDVTSVIVRMGRAADPVTAEEVDRIVEECR